PSACWGWCSKWSRRARKGGLADSSEAHRRPPRATQDDEPLLARARYDAHRAWVVTSRPRESALGRRNSPAAGGTHAGRVRSSAVGRPEGPRETALRTQATTGSERATVNTGARCHLK